MEEEIENVNASKSTENSSNAVLVYRGNTLEDNINTCASCIKCQERFKHFFDQQQMLKKDNIINCNNENTKKMSWQIWRESTLDRRFQYENRFRLVFNI